MKMIHKIKSIVAIGLSVVISFTLIYHPAHAFYNVDFGVGQGIIWPSQVFAPYVDMTAWNNNLEYSYNGVLSLEKIYKDTGVKYFNLGFINAADSNIINGSVNWAWGGECSAVVLEL